MQVSNTSDHTDIRPANSASDSAVISFDPAKDPAAVTLTPAAATHLAQSLAKQSAEAVRLGVTESGCNGYMYDLSFAETIDAQDHRYEFPLAQTQTRANHARARASVILVVSKQALPLVQGTQIDYVTEGLNSALKFRNPNADTHCGCGESFSVSAPEDV